MNYHYAPAITTHVNQLASIDAAYKAAGVTPPSRAVAILAAVRAEPTAAAVAADLAREALTAEDPDKFHADAIARIARAQAGDALRTALAREIPAAQERSMSDRITQAVEDLTPAITRTVKALTNAAKKLPAGPTPLDLTAVVATDTTKEMKAAHTALNLLGTMTAIYQSAYGIDTGNTPPSLRRHLPILDIPECTVELQPRTFATVIEPLNGHQLTETRAVRELAKDIAKDPDTTLVRVARGDYAGVGISLATPAELQQRADRAHDAHTRRRVDADAAVTVMR